MKQAFVEAEFSHLVAHRNRVSGRGTGSNARLAIQRAIAKLLKEPSVRGTRLDGKSFKLLVTVTTVAEEKKSRRQLYAQDPNEEKSKLIPVADDWGS